MAERFDTVVVGAGAMGSATAWRLAGRGRSVALVEQFEQGHTRGSSHGATRIFRVAYRDPAYVALAAEALDGWRELEADVGESLLDQCGQLDHGDPAAIAEVANNLTRAGFVAQWICPDEAAQRWPGMTLDRSVVHSPDGGRVLADRTVSALQRRCVELGVDVAFEEPVTRVDHVADGVEVRTERRALRADTVVVAAGPWVREVVPATLQLPDLVPSVETPAFFAPHDDATPWPSFLHHVDDASGALRFAAYGLASTPAEGVKVGVDGATDALDVADYVRRWLPGLDPSPIGSTTCTFTTSPDDHFVLERHGPVVVCSPCSGHGFKFVPTIGSLAADLCEGRAPRYRFGR